MLLKRKKKALKRMCLLKLGRKKIWEKKNLVKEKDYNSYHFKDDLDLLGLPY